MVSCYKREALPIEPSLEFLYMDKDSIYQGFSQEDSLTIYLLLKDGDGDIGFSNADSVINSIYIRDLRTGNISEQFNIPAIPDNIAVNGIEAELELKLYTTCCLFPDNIPPCSIVESYPRDTLIYEITIEDRAGHISEPIQTLPIILLCQ
jgi:hypothetical protein